MGQLKQHSAPPVNVSRMREADSFMGQMFASVVNMIGGGGEKDQEVAAAEPAASDSKIGFLIDHGNELEEQPNDIVAVHEGDDLEEIMAELMPPVGNHA